MTESLRRGPEVFVLLGKDWWCRQSIDLLPLLNSLYFEKNTGNFARICVLNAKRHRNNPANSGT